VHLTDGVYAPEMSFGPDDVGHWKDKLPYVEHDLKLVAEREDILKRFGPFTAGFDFGGPVKSQPGYGNYRQDNYVLQNTVEPRFQPVDPDTRYIAERGFGWLAAGEREAVAIPLTPYLELRAVAKDPQNLPHDLLYRDYIHGRGAQTFSLKADPGGYHVSLIHPDRSADDLNLRAENGRLDIPFPTGEWSVSGIVVKGSQPPPAYPSPVATALPSRPAISHQPPASAREGSPLTLQLAISGKHNIRTVRLYYRPVNQLAKFKILESIPGRPFTIPAADLSAKWDLMYYFEVLNETGGWFQPDPLRQTPYYVVTVRPN
jgi:hypothetical protein